MKRRKNQSPEKNNRDPNVCSGPFYAMYLIYFRSVLPPISHQGLVGVSDTTVSLAALSVGADGGILEASGTKISESLAS
jgi:hypothetical protein